MAPTKQYSASIPGNDPRFAELRAALEAAQGQGRYSPTSRMLGEWALIGFLFASGKIPMGGANPDALQDAQQDFAAQQAAQHHVDAALSGLDWE